MNKFKYSIVAATFLVFVGCGGGGGESQAPANTTPSTQASRAVTFTSLQSDIKEAKKIISENTQAYKDVQTLEEEIKKLQILNEDEKNKIQTRAAIAINFDVTTIPARLQLANELLKSIVLTATSDEYKYKKSTEITRISLKIVAAIFNVVNPLSKDENIKASIKDLNGELAKLKASPDQTNNEYANVNLKEDLARVLRKYRAKSDEIKNKQARAEFDGYILKVTGVRLALTSSVQEVKNYIKEVPQKFNEALEKSGVETVAISNEPLTQDQIDLVFNVLKSSQDLTRLDSLNTDVKAQIDKLAKFFGGLGLLEPNVNITGTNLQFSLNSLTDRSKLALDIIRAIVISTNDFKYKKEDVHVQLGFEVTNALIAATNPFANLADLQEATKKLNDKLTWANQQDNLKSTDTANLYIKESMATKLREYRTFQFNVLKNKHKEVINEFNDKILKATGVRLDIHASVQEVYDTLKDLEAAAKKAIDSADLTSEEVSASQAQRIELDSLLHKARTLDLSEKQASARIELDKIIWKITGIRLDLNSTVKDIEQAKLDIQNAIEQAKNATNLKDELIAPFNLKIKLSNLIAKARFTSGIGFSNESVISADKVWWNPKATVKQVNDAISSIEVLFN